MGHCMPRRKLGANMRRVTDRTLRTRDRRKIPAALTDLCYISSSSAGKKY
jgi:hypothetical protein